MTNLLISSFVGRTGEERLICGDEEEEKRGRWKIDGKWVGNLRGSYKAVTE
jgi:hypothetical protein